MPVYMIRAGDTGPVKIGHSNDPVGRLVGFQVVHYEKLRIIRLFEGGEAEEAQLHVRFADLYIRGDWHAFSRLMLGDVGLVEIGIEQKQPAAPTDQTSFSAEQIIKDLGGATALSRHIELGQRSAISNWPKYGIPARYWPALTRIAATSSDTQHITIEELERHTHPSPAPVDAA